jgi:hypothetical protein
VVNHIAVVDAEFNTTVLAQKFHESKRLSAANKITTKTILLDQNR